MELDIAHIAKSIEYEHTCEESTKKMEFHLHNRYEIYLFISGNVNYFIEKSIYRLKYGNLLVMNSNEIHKSCPEPGTTYDRYIIHFNPIILSKLSTPEYDLSSCFVKRVTGLDNLFILSEEQVACILKLFQNFEEISSENQSYSIIKVALFMQILVYINELFKEIKYYKEEKHQHNVLSDKLRPILDYIDSNLDQDLSLEEMENKFFINKYYLCRLFKSTTGCNLNEYIKYKRIARAKTLLAEGYNVTETCSLSGFNDYSHFIRSFKQKVGVSPGKYQKELALVPY